jgi:hypothetical protein
VGQRIETVLSQTYCPNSSSDRDDGSTDREFRDTEIPGPDAAPESFKTDLPILPPAPSKPAESLPITQKVKTIHGTLTCVAVLRIAVYAPIATCTSVPRNSSCVPLLNLLPPSVA